MSRFSQLVEVRQQQINVLHNTGCFTYYKCNKEISYTPMGGSLIINVFVYTQNGGSQVTSLICLKPIFLI